MALVTVSEVGGVDEAESGGSEEFAFLAFAGGGFHQLGGVPFAEIDIEPLQLEPAFQEVNLGGFSRAIQPFDGDQPAGEIEFCERLHLLQRRLKLCGGKTIFLLREWLAGK
jgi:hypothetical protein